MTLQEPVVDVRNLSRCFGSKRALDDVCLEVPVGSVFGIVGENGAGKTTLLRHVMGMLRAEEGSVRVFGLDPVREAAPVLSRIGYLSDAQDLPGWMRVDQLLSYTQTFYPTWDEGYAEELVATLEIDTAARVKHLSKGQHARVGLILALAHHPELLILDEPSSGLDPVVRREILEAIIHSIAEAGCTVVFSSHLLDEVERVSDYVAMLKSGNLLMCDSLESIKGSYRLLTLSFEDHQATPPGSPPAISWQGSGREWTAVCQTLPEDLAAEVTMIGGQVVDSRVPTLDEIFIAHSVPTSRS